MNPACRTGRGQHALACVLTALCLCACGGAPAAKQAQALPPVNAGALDKMVRAVSNAEAGGNNSRAVELLRQALEIDPNLWEARYDLGVLLAEGGDLVQAQNELERAAELAPNAEDVAVALGEVRRRRRQPEEAAQGLKTFVEAYPGADAARAVLVGALRDAGQFAEALEQARQILVRRANDPNALAELALTHLARGEIDTAELLSAEALKAKEPSAAAHRTAGLIALEQGDDARAFQHFAHASEVDPKDHTSQINIGNVLLKAGVYDKAAGYFRAILEINSDDAEATLGLAAALRGQGTRYKQEPYVEAERLLKGLLKRQPNNLEATFNLGVLYASYLDRNAEAVTLMKHFLSQAPREHPARPIAERISKSSTNSAP